jgi:hypothetical protein
MTIETPVFLTDCNPVNRTVCGCGAQDKDGKMIRKRFPDHDFRITAFLSGDRLTKQFPLHQRGVSG